MTDTELDAKFMDQALAVLPKDRAERLLHLCRSVSTTVDVGREIAGLL